MLRNSRTQPRLFTCATLATLTLDAFGDFPLRHLLRHEKHQCPVTFFHAAEQAAELCKHALVFAGVTPHKVIGGLSFWQIRELRWFFTIIEKLVHWDFEGAGELPQGLYSRNCVSVFDTGDVATEQAG